MERALENNKTILREDLGGLSEGIFAYECNRGASGLSQLIIVSQVQGLRQRVPAEGFAADEDREKRAKGHLKS